MKAKRETVNRNKIITKDRNQDKYGSTEYK